MDRRSRRSVTTLAHAALLVVRYRQRHSQHVMEFLPTDRRWGDASPVHRRHSASVKHPCGWRPSFSFRPRADRLDHDERGTDRRTCRVELIGAKRQSTSLTLGGSRAAAAEVAEPKESMKRLALPRVNTPAEHLNPGSLAAR